MKYKLLGKSGLRVSELCLGTMTFGEERGTMGNTKKECRKIFDAFADAGGNYIDTANVYMYGTSEKWVGEFVRSQRDKFVVASKYTLTMDPVTTPMPMAVIERILQDPSKRASDA